MGYASLISCDQITNVTKCEIMSLDWSIKVAGYILHLPTAITNLQTKMLVFYSHRCLINIQAKKAIQCNLIVRIKYMTDYVQRQIDLW